MIRQDHSELGEYLIRHMEGCADLRCRLAFRFGSIEPDYNLLTYLRGSIHQQTLRGHNYENSRSRIKKMIQKLQEENLSGIRKYYLLGKLIHFIADAFTYPHNEIFHGTLKEHCIYENQFHKYFGNNLQKEDEFYITEQEQGLFRQIEELHRNYLIERRDFFSDCKYIWQATSMIFSHFTENEENSACCLKSKIA